jgi:hypothetical protein
MASAAELFADAAFAQFLLRVATRPVLRAIAA